MTDPDHPWRLLRLAVQLLDRSAGFPALTDALRSSGAYTSWHATTIGDLIGAFRGISPQLARRIATAPGNEIAGCHPDDIAQLADQLDLHTAQ